MQREDLERALESFGCKILRDDKGEEPVTYAEEQTQKIHARNALTDEGQTELLTDDERIRSLEARIKALEECLPRTRAEAWRPSLVPLGMADPDAHELMHGPAR